MLEKLKEALADSPIIIFLTMTKRQQQTIKKWRSLGNNTMTNTSASRNKALFRQRDMTS